MSFNLRTPKIVAALVFASLLSSCSGTMDVKPCLSNGRLAFQLGDIPWLLVFKQRPTPHHLAVQIPGPPHWEDEKAWEQKLMWDIHAGSGARERAIVLYGQEPPEFTVTKPARKLQIGTKYRVWVSAGMYVGSADFTYTSALPACERQITD